MLLNIHSVVINIYDQMCVKCFHLVTFALEVNEPRSAVCLPGCPVPACIKGVLFAGSSESCRGTDTLSSSLLW